MGRPKIPEGTHKIPISATISPEAFEVYQEYTHKSEKIEEFILSNGEISKLKMQIEEQKRIITDLIYFKEYIISLIHRDALQAYDNKMSPEEIEKWEAL